MPRSPRCPREATRWFCKRRHAFAAARRAGRGRHTNVNNATRHRHATRRRRDHHGGFAQHYTHTARYRRGRQTTFNNATAATAATHDNTRPRARATSTRRAHRPQTHNPQKDALQAPPRLDLRRRRGLPGPGRLQGHVVAPGDVQPVVVRRRAVAPGHPEPDGLLRPGGPLERRLRLGAQALPRGRAHARPRRHARVARLPRRRVGLHAPLRGQDRRHRHQPVLAGADGLLARDPPLHRRAGDVPRAPRLDGADGAGELLPAPPGLHPRRPRPAQCRNLPTVRCLFVCCCDVVDVDV